MSKLAVCIPTYEMNGRGKEYLEYSLDILSQQSYKDFIVFVSDHSVDNEIIDLCEEFFLLGRLNVFHLDMNSKFGNSSANLNNAIREAKRSCEIIKVLFQDDFLYDTLSLEKTVEAFSGDIVWAVSRSQHSEDGINFIRDFMPRYNDDIHLGLNTISSPSVLSFRSDVEVEFDENLNWLMDCDFYKRMYMQYGLPKIIEDVTVVNRIGIHQVSAGMTQDRIDKELVYVRNKYDSD